MLLVHRLNGILPVGLIRKIKYLERKRLPVWSWRIAWHYVRRTYRAIMKGARAIGKEASDIQDMARLFFRMLEIKLDLKNRQEPPTEEEVKEAIEQLKDVGRISLFATISLLPGGGFSLIGLELLARKFGVKSFTLVPRFLRNKRRKRISKGDVPPSPVPLPPSHIPLP